MVNHAEGPTRCWVKKGKLGEQVLHTQVSSGSEGRKEDDVMELVILDYSRQKVRLNMEGRLSTCMKLLPLPRPFLDAVG